MIRPDRYTFVWGGGACRELLPRYEYLNPLDIQVRLGASPFYLLMCRIRISHGSIGR